jgi:hypothetical protein
MPMPPIPTKWMGPISRGSLIVVPWASSSAKAGDPVWRNARDSNQPGGVLDAPLSQRMTRGNFGRNRLDSDDFRKQTGQTPGRIEPADGAGTSGRGRRPHQA